MKLQRNNKCPCSTGKKYKLKIHPAIVAGRIQFEKNNYRILSQFMGRGEVEKLFKRNG